MPRIGIDEKSFAKGQSYFTLIYDLDRSTVEAISEGHDSEAADACFSQLSAEQITSIEAIAMDMSAAFVKSAKANIPLAKEKIVHDRFHVMKLATEAVDKVRRQEHRELKQQKCLPPHTVLPKFGRQTSKDSTHHERGSIATVSEVGIAFASSHTPQPNAYARF